MHGPTNEQNHYYCNEICKLDLMASTMVRKESIFTNLIVCNSLFMASAKALPCWLNKGQRDASLWSIAKAFAEFR